MASSNTELLVIDLLICCLNVVTCCRGQRRGAGALREQCLAHSTAPHSRLHLAAQHFPADQQRAPAAPWRQGKRSGSARSGSSSGGLAAFREGPLPLPVGAVQFGDNLETSGSCLAAEGDDGASARSSRTRMGQRRRVPAHRGRIRAAALAQARDGHQQVPFVPARCHVQ